VLRAHRLSRDFLHRQGRRRPQGRHRGAAQVQSARGPALRRPNRQLQGQRHRVDLDRRGTPQDQVRDRQTPDLPAYRKGEVDLMFIRRNWYLAGGAPEEIKATKVLGVDLGIVNLATDSDGTHPKVRHGAGPDSTSRHQGRQTQAPHALWQTTEVQGHPRTGQGQPRPTRQVHQQGVSRVRGDFLRFVWPLRPR
jgi:hypothetical protein